MYVLLKCLAGMTTLMFLLWAQAYACNHRHTHTCNHRRRGSHKHACKCVCTHLICECGYRRRNVSAAWVTAPMAPADDPTTRMGFPSAMSASSSTASRICDPRNSHGDVSFANVHDPFPIHASEEQYLLSTYARRHTHTKRYHVIMPHGTLTCDTGHEQIHVSSAHHSPHDDDFGACRHAKLGDSRMKPEHINVLVRVLG